jgi:hypothetical protein
MKHLNDFPDLSISFAKMKLQDKFDEVPDNTILGFAIRNARINKRHLQTISSDVMEAYYDNPKAVVDIVGQDTIDLIRKIYYPA